MTTIKRKNELNISKWGGGSTTELFIFPQDSSYQKRDFEFRISSATVEETPSTFTILPSYKRVLMPLSAPLNLAVEGQDEITVCPFASIEFDGAKKTVSNGICTDIGVMLSGGWKASLYGAYSLSYQITAFAGVYALCDDVKVISDNQEHVLYSGDFLVFKTEKPSKITLTLPHKNAAVVAVVDKKKYDYPNNS